MSDHDENAPPYTGDAAISHDGERLEGVLIDIFGCQIQFVGVREMPGGSWVLAGHVHIPHHLSQPVDCEGTVPYRPGGGSVKR